MNTRLIISFLTLFVVSALPTEAQTRYPIHARVSINQRIFEPPTTTISIQELKFEGQRSHSLGLGVGVDFGLNELDKTTTNWILATSMNLFSVPLKYRATLPKAIHGLDRDATWIFKRYSAGFEAALGIVRESKLNKVWDLRLGLGANVQDMYFNSTKLQHTVTVFRNGAANPETVFGAQFDPRFGFGFVPTPRQKQDLKFNAVYTVGVTADINANRQFVAELKICHSGQNIVQPLNFLFGDTGDFVYKKSYIGLDLAYRFSLNKRLSSSVK